MQPTNEFERHVAATLKAHGEMLEKHAELFRRATEHEALQSQFRNDLTQSIEGIKHHLDRQDGATQAVSDSIAGNMDRKGLLSKVDNLERNQATVAKLAWAVFGLILTMIGGIVLHYINSGKP